VIKPPSIIAEYSLIYSGDSALNLPADPKEAAAALDRARETNQWQSLLKEGEMPTLFHVRPLYGSLHTWFIGEVNRRGMVQKESVEFALRLVLERIDNFGPFKVGHTTDEGQRIATTETIDAIYAAPDGRAIVEELGLLILVRAQQGLPGKS